jgi:hypothetical protein
MSDPQQNNMSLLDLAPAQPWCPLSTHQQRHDPTHSTLSLLFRMAASLASRRSTRLQQPPIGYLQHVDEPADITVSHDYLRCCISQATSIPSCFPALMSGSQQTLPALSTKAEGGLMLFGNSPDRYCLLCCRLHLSADPCQALPQHLAPLVLSMRHHAGTQAGRQPDTTRQADRQSDKQAGRHRNNRPLDRKLKIC